MAPQRLFFESMLGFEPRISRELHTFFRIGEAAYMEFELAGALPRGGKGHEAISVLSARWRWNLANAE